MCTVSFVTFRSIYCCDIGFQVKYSDLFTLCTCGAEQMLRLDDAWVHMPKTCARAQSLQLFRVGRSWIIYAGFAKGFSSGLHLYVYRWPVTFYTCMLFEMRGTAGNFYSQFLKSSIIWRGEVYNLTDYFLKEEAIVYM